jgi:hypothetical protein
MKKAELALPEIMLIAGTRVMLGAGGALLLADQLEKGEEMGPGLVFQHRKMRVGLEA